MSTENAFALLCKEVRELAEERFSVPTDVQSLVIPRILGGKSILVISETGSGKTESVLLPAFSRLAAGDMKPISVLYITPLRSLNRDMLKRVLWWAEKIGFEVSVRHSDTTRYERRMQSQNPAEMLITTPETLQAILAGRVMKEHLKNVMFVVIDEVHELAGSKRGSALAVALERLKSLMSRENLQIIGLSATVGNPELVREFIGAQEVVVTERKKKISIAVHRPKTVAEDKAECGKMFVSPATYAKLRFIKDSIGKFNSTLIFTNTRQLAEALSSRLKAMGCASVETHHSSLSRTVRIAAEDDFREGRLKALVCTSSLELGIDIGSVDFVVQYGSSRQVSKLLQRVGRAGHSMDRTSLGCLLPLDTDDAFESCAIANLSKLYNAEEIKPVMKPLDVLAHQIAGLALDEWAIPFSKAHSIIKRAYPFRGLSEEEMLECCLFMQKLGYIRLEEKVNYPHIIIKRKSKTFSFYNENLSTIPDMKTYKLIDSHTRRAVASLDAEFVSLNAQPGAAIIAKGQGWKVLEIGDYTVTAEPLPTLTAAIPAWEGELIPVPYEVVAEVGRLRKMVKENIESNGLGGGLEDVERGVMKYMKSGVSEEGIADSSRIIIERGVHGSEFFLVINSCFGSLVNETIARAVSALAAGRVGSLGMQTDPYRIIFRLRQLGDWRDIADTFFGLVPDSIEKILAIDLPAGELFAWHFAHVAKRFGIIKRDAELGKGYLRKVIRAYRDTIPYREALAELFRQKLDVGKAAEIIGKVRSGQIAVEVRDSLSAISIGGIERRYELIGAERPEKEIFDMFRERLLDTKIGMVCCNCGEVYYMGPVREADAGACKKCSSLLLAVTPFNFVREMQMLIRKNLKGEKMSEDERKTAERLLDSASLAAASGTDAISVLAGRGVGPKTAGRILARMNTGDRLLADILEAERRYVRTRGYWKD